jgi:4,5-DOPA dioxygenase extradiol
MNTVIESLFISHGAPTFALEPGQAGQALEVVGQQLLAQGSEVLILLSPHWRSARLAVTSHEAPVIVHDFYGFPDELYTLRPEIAGDPRVASLLVDHLAGKEMPLELHPQQGFDHGAWVPYLHLFPKGGPRLVQISMPVNWTGALAMAVGEAIGEFARNNRAVVVGSGSLTHNFNDMNLGTAQGEPPQVPAYVSAFTDWVGQQLMAGNRQAIAHAGELAPQFSQAHPDDDHYLPLPFALGASSPDCRVEALPGDVRYRALSMQSHVFRKAA